MSTNTQTRIAEIKARAEAVLNMKPSKTQTQFEHNLKVGKEFEKHALADIDWLVAEVERHEYTIRGLERMQCEQDTYIARLEARLRTALRSEFWEDASIDDVNTPRCQEYIDSEMAKLKEST
jgi:hypothetical protein